MLCRVSNKVRERVSGATFFHVWDCFVCFTLFMLSLVSLWTNSSTKTTCLVEYTHIRIYNDFSFTKLRSKLLLPREKLQSALWWTHCAISTLITH